MNRGLTLFVDGLWGGNPIRFAMLRNRLAQQVGEVDQFHYDSSGNSTFEELGQQLATRIRELGRPVNLVGFSMGGIVIRTAHLLHPNLPVQRAAFLNVPHQGSLLAHLMPLRGLQQLKPGGEFMRRMKDQPWNIPSLAVWCPGDLMVIPGHNACWHRATENIRSDVPAHIWPLISKSLHQRVADFLRG